MIVMSDPKLLSAEEKSHIRDNLARVLSEILTDRYGEEYGVTIKLRFEKKGAEK